LIISKNARLKNSQTLEYMRLLLTIGYVGILILLNGCAGYSLGPVNKMSAGSQSIQINPFQNDTKEPRLGMYLSSALRKRIQQDGTFLLDTRNEGDIIVDGVITQYIRNPVTFLSGDTQTARDFQAIMVVQVRAQNRFTKDIILDRKVRGQSTFRVTDDQASVERQTMPMLAEELSRRIASLLTEGDW
jgi:hypothetical protein